MLILEISNMRPMLYGGVIKMGNSVYSGPHIATTNDTFRASGLAISNALAACGLVKLSDTGTINWATVTMPTTSYTIAGWEMWRFTDSLQATSPVFLKIGYGKYGFSTLYLDIRVGSATDGELNLSGTESGTVYKIQYGGSSNFDDTGVRISLFSFDGSGLYIATMVDGAVGVYPRGGRVIVDRFRNGDGSPSGNGLFVMHSFSSSNPAINVVDRINNIVYTNGGGSLIPMVAPAGYSLRQSDGSVPLGVFYAMVPSVGIYRSKMILSIPQTDIGFLGEFQADHLGSIRTYKAHGIYDGGWDSMIQTTISSAQWWSD